MKLLRVLLAVWLITAAVWPGTVLAQETPPQVHQENPDTAKPVYNSLALLTYYAGVLDQVMQLDAKDVEISLNKMQFAGIPDSLASSAFRFSSSGRALAYHLEDLAAMWEQGKLLASQYRLEELRSLFQQAKERAPALLGDLDRLQLSVSDTAAYFKIQALPPGHQLRVLYQAVLDRIDQVRQMPGRFEKLIEELTAENLPELPDKPTALNLEPGAETAFVGDRLFFDGFLSCQGQPLGGRNIDILLDRASAATLITDEQGHYQGSLTLPYRYIPLVKLQALYYPQGQDQAAYPAALSKEYAINLLYYESLLTWTSDGQVYPGRTAQFKGSLDYHLVNREKMPAGEALVEESPAAGRLFSRPLEIYLDDALLTQFTAETSFSRPVDMPPDIEAGRHTLTISANAQGRLAPVTAGGSLTVIRAAVTADLQAPAGAWMPGSFVLSGHLRSELGALEGAKVRVEGMDSFPVTAGQPVKAGQNEAGYFESKVETGMGGGLLGTRTLEISIQPREPWNAPLTLKKNLFMVNYVFLGSLLALAASLYLVLRRRLRKWFAMSKGIPAQPRPAVAHREAAAAVLKADTVVLPEPAPSKDPAAGGGVENRADKRLLHWFYQAVELVQRITGTLFKPDQTLREFDRQSGPKLGPLAGAFHELAMLAEKALYSRRQSPPADEDKARKLAEGLANGLKKSGGK